MQHFCQLDDDVRFVQRFKPLSGEEMEAVWTVAVTAGPGGAGNSSFRYARLPDGVYCVVAGE